MGESSNDSQVEGTRKYERSRTSSGTISESSGGSKSSHENHHVNSSHKQTSRWEALTDRLRRPIVALLHFITTISANEPKLTIAVSLLLGGCILMVGYSTNFHVIVEQMTLWTPLGSKPLQHQLWRDNQSGFPDQAREVIVAIHAEGENILGRPREVIDRMFVALDAVRGLPGYDELCRHTNYVDSLSKNTCKVHGVTRFFEHSSDLFDELVSDDSEAIAAISSPYYSDGTPVNEYDVFGYPVRDVNGTLVSAEITFLVIELPPVPQAEEFEAELLDVLIDGFREGWQRESGNEFRLEAQAYRTFSDEFTRAIEDDIPLLPVVFGVMGVFTCMVFWKYDRVQSRCLLGFGAVFSVLLAILSGYGLMFTLGVPFTSMTPLLPFIMFGIGLDDAFIISDSFERTDRCKSIEERIHDTFEECGLSITLTAITSTLAFALGCISSIPAVYWLSLYAFPTVVLVLLYQLTFFTACIVLDERRLQANLRDVCFCISGSRDEDRAEQTDSSDLDKEQESSPRREPPTASISERIMLWYANLLLRPPVKIAVLVIFATLSAACAMSASGLKQEFNYVEILPSDSYALGFYNAVQDYSIRSPVLPFVYFRDVDQSDPEIQAQMLQFIDELVAMDEIDNPPTFFWLNDFNEFVDKREYDFLGDLSFNEQMTLFLADPVYNRLHSDNIVLDKYGNITASRALILMDNVDFHSVNKQIEALMNQRAISRSQPVNRGRSDWAFFLYDEVFNYWELYAVSVEELILTTFMGMVAVGFVSLVLIPHWTAAAYVLPTLMVLYVDLLGVLGWAGIKINPVTFVALVLSIGLMVDYLMHVLLRYYECAGTREERVVEALRTMGSSILVGGISTFLGTMPLAFSSSEIFMTIFYSFLGFVTLGAGHGLILLPVVLSVIGPEDSQLTDKEDGSSLRLEEIEE